VTRRYCFIHTSRTHCVVIRHPNVMDSMRRRNISTSTVKRHFVLSIPRTRFLLLIPRTRCVLSIPRAHCVLHHCVLQYHELTASSTARTRCVAMSRLKIMNSISHPNTANSMRARNITNSTMRRHCVIHSPRTRCVVISQHSSRTRCVAMSRLKPTNSMGLSNTTSRMSHLRAANSTVRRCVS